MSLIELFYHSARLLRRLQAQEFELLVTSPDEFTETCAPMLYDERVETRNRVRVVDGEAFPPALASTAVHIEDLRKVYVVSRQEAGVRSALQGLVQRRKLEIPAVDGISFDLASGGGLPPYACRAD